MPPPSSASDVYCPTTPAVSGEVITLPVAPPEGASHSNSATNRKAATDATTRAIKRLSMS